MRHACQAEFIELENIIGKLFVARNQELLVGFAPRQAALLQRRAATRKAEQDHADS